MFKSPAEIIDAARRRMGAGSYDPPAELLITLARDGMVPAECLNSRMSADEEAEIRRRDALFREGRGDAVCGRQRARLLDELDATRWQLAAYAEDATLDARESDERWTKMRDARDARDARIVELEKNLEEERARRRIDDERVEGFIQKLKAAEAQRDVLMRAALQQHARFGACGALREALAQIHAETEIASSPSLGTPAKDGERPAGGGYTEGT